MSTYQRYLTVGNSAYRNVIEPSGGDTGNDYMRVGNNSGGAAYWILLKLPTDLPKPAQVSEAILRLTEYDSSYRGDGSLTMHIVRVKSPWSMVTTFNGMPAYDTSKVANYVLNSSNNPDSSNYDGRTYHAAKYKYKKYLMVGGDPGNLKFEGYVYYNDNKGSGFTSGNYYYTYYSTISAFYDDYWVWQNVNITGIIQDCINSGCTGLLLYFTLPGANNTRKYFRSSLCTNANDQPRLTITYTADEPTTPTIPTFTMGAAGNIDLSSKTSSGLTHTLRYKFGSETGTIATKTSNISCSWTPGIDVFAKEVPNAASGTGTLYCDTYSGNTLLGTKAVTLTMAVPSSVKPSISNLGISMVSSNSIVAGWGEFVKGYSKARLSASALGVYDSSISSYYFAVMKGSTVVYSVTQSGKVWTSGIIAAPGSDYKFYLKVTDTRGRTATIESNAYTVYNYSAPSISAVDAFRCNSGGALDIESGKYISAKGAFGYSSVGGKNSIARKIEYRQKGTSSWVVGKSNPVNNTAYVFGGGAISTSYSYEVKFTVTDELVGSVTYTFIVPPGFVTFAIKKDGKGVGFGGEADADEFQVYMPAVFKDGINGSGCALINNHEITSDNGNTYSAYPLGISHSIIVSSNRIQSSGENFPLYGSVHTENNSSWRCWQMLISNDGTIFHRTYYETDFIPWQLLYKNIEWIAPTLFNNWQNYGNGYREIGYKKEQNTVKVRGFVTGGTRGEIMKFPSGYRPTQREIQPALVYVNGTGWETRRIDFWTDGYLIVDGTPPYWVILSHQFDID